MKNISRQRFAYGWVVLIVGLLGAGILVLWGVHGRTGAPAAPAPELELVELVRTNLEHHSDGWFQKGRTNAYTGILVDYYPSGRIMSRSVVSNGLLSGLSEGWYTNGQLQVRETYQLNLSDGIRTRWYASGKKMSEATVVQGQMTGMYRRWYESGRLAEEIPMKDGNINGDGRAYYPSGFLKAAVKYVAGKAVEQKAWLDGEQKGG